MTSTLCDVASTFRLSKQAEVHRHHLTSELNGRRVLFFIPGIVVYRIFLNENTLRVLRPLNVDKKKVKLAHAIIMGSALPLMVIGLKAVFDNHDLRETPIPNMYSLHSWVGIICVILFFTQWVCGLVTFLAPGLAPRLRALYLPVHVYFGMLIFILAFASVISGITEIAIFSM